MTELGLDKGIEHISTLFSHEDHVPPLRRLSVLNGPASLPLIIGAVRTLEHIRFGSPSAQTGPISIPHLLSLCSFEIEADFLRDRIAPWVRDGFTTLIHAELYPPGGNIMPSSSRPLEEAIITYLFMRQASSILSPYAEYLAQLGRTLSSLARTPRMPWWLSFVRRPLVFETYEPKKWNDEFL
ncbi:hypothetical protein MVEN_00285300 [Mycena venus]|uniref:Uncharacterized protein n=1 Tax=Mycena venus TaxID=2733690 RepID=A0A8H7DET9_9AGAR|nr:hypothetical protein MVEN_00285300 [Mycena venus]